MARLTPSKGFPTRLIERFRDLVELHLQTPEIPVALNAAKVQAAQAARALSSTRIYLDLNHWINLTEAALQRSSSEEEYRTLWTELSKLVAEGLVVVPITGQMVDEICRQADHGSRLEIAGVIDTLSDGVTIVGWQHRQWLELLHWVNSLVEPGSKGPLTYVWTNLMNVYAFLRPEVKGAEKAFASAFLKAVDDIAPEMRLSDFIGALGTQNPDAPQELADELSHYKETIWTGQGSFDQVFLEESWGYFDRLPPLPNGVAASLSRLPLADGLQGRALLENAHRAFIAADGLGLVATGLPLVRILAGANSRVRLESGRRFKAGDTADTLHAAAALPYCNFFVTDRSTRHLFTTAPTDFGSRFDCTVLARASELKQYLQRLPA